MRILAVVVLSAMLAGCAAIAAGTIGTVLGNIGADVIEGKYPEKSDHQEGEQMIGFVLVMTIAGSVGYYSGDGDVKRPVDLHKPYVFKTLEACSKVMVPQAISMKAQRDANPKLPAFELRCETLDKVNIERAPIKQDSI